MENRNEVVVVDIKMPFLSMVEFMVKWVIACIPALFILIFIGAFIYMFLMRIIPDFFHHIA